jgi:hypothetical protein
MRNYAYRYGASIGAAVLICVSLGCAGEATQPEIRRSALILESPHLVCDAGEIGPYWWYIGAEDAQGASLGHAYFVHQSQSATGSLTVAGETCALCGFTWVTSTGGPYFLLGTLDANEQFSLFRFHDSSGDGIPDLSTQVLLLDSGTSPSYVTYLSRPGTSSRLFLLDARCQDILLATDTNQDGWPDTVSGTPFAMADSYPILATAQLIRAVSDVEVMVPSGGIWHWTREANTVHRNAARPFYRYVDEDSDGIADDEVFVSSVHVSRPHMIGSPYGNQVILVVQGASGRTAQVWRLADDLEPIEELGSAVLLANPVDIALSEPLTTGELVGVRYSDDEDSLSIDVVRETGPQVLSIDGVPLTTDGGTITLHGENLTSSMTVVLTTTESAYTLSYQVVNSKEATATVPELDAEDAGLVMLSVRPSSPSTASGRDVLSFAILDAAVDPFDPDEWD